MPPPMVMLTMPACPHPATTTRPCSVSRTSDWSSGMLSSTIPRSVRMRPDGCVQLRSGCTRGTGPVSHTPGHSSLLVKLKEKVNIILMGDLAHFHEN